MHGGELALSPDDVDIATALDETSLPHVPARRVPGLSAKRLKLVEAMIYEGKTRDEAAKAVGLTSRGARYAMTDPRVLAIYKRHLQSLRESEKPKAIGRLAELRDQKDSQRIAFEASRELAREPVGGPVINVGVGLNIAPGFILDVSEHSRAAKHILARAGSVRNAMDDREVER